MTRPRPLLDRLADKFLIDDGCWQWTASTSSAGYGQIYTGGQGKNKMSPAHRVLYELLVGPIPDGLELDHLCRNRGCVKPSHLEPVTHTENVRRGIVGEVNRARQLAITHCPQGHEYNDDNTSWKPTTSGKARVCLACKRDYYRRTRARQPR